MKSLTKLIVVGLFVAALGGVLSISGCGAPSSSNAADVQPDPKKVEMAKNMRAYFDKVHGDYAQLSAEDKAAYVKLAGSDAKAQELWDLMKNGASRMASPSGPPNSAPSGSGSN